MDYLLISPIEPLKLAATNQETNANSILEKGVTKNWRIFTGAEIKLRDKRD